MFSSSILVGTIEKSVPLNLIKVILNVGVIWNLVLDPYSWTDVVA